MLREDVLNNTIMIKKIDSNLWVGTYHEVYDVDTEETIMRFEEMFQLCNNNEMEVIQFLHAISK